MVKYVKLYVKIFVVIFAVILYNKNTNFQIRSNTMKKAILMLIVVSLLASFVLTACANNDDKSDVTDPEIEKEPTWEDNDFDFEGATISFVYVEGEEGGFTRKSISPDMDAADDGDAVVSALYERNQKIQNAYNVKIEAILGATGISGLSGAISNSLAAGLPDYDVIAGFQYYDIPLATKGYLLDYNTLANYDADYLNLDADYWGTSYINAISANNRIYWITGDIALRYIGGMYCTFVNGDIYRDVLQSTYGSIYDIVDNGDWTLDTFYAMMCLAYNDNNGNDIADEEDRLGWVSEICDDSEAMAIAAGVKFSERYADGSIGIAFKSERTTDFSKKYYDMVYSNKMLSYPQSSSTLAMGTFASGNTLFVVNKLFQSQVYLQELENFYVIPLPKLNKEQENYISFLHDGCTLFGINVSTDVLQATTATLEAMAQISHKNVAPVYFDSALKYQYTRDANSARMIDLIHSTITTDFAAAWSNSLNEIAHFFRDNTKGLKSVNSTMSKMVPAWSARLEQLLEELDSAGET